MTGEIIFLREVIGEPASTECKAYSCDLYTVSPELRALFANGTPVPEIQRIVKDGRIYCIIQRKTRAAGFLFVSCEQPVSCDDPLPVLLIMQPSALTVHRLRTAYSLD